MRCVRERDLFGVLGRGTCAVLGRGTCAVC